MTNLASGAYAVRVTQQRAGEAPLARTLGLVAPTAAEYRLLGANEALLAAIRAATGGREVDAPADAWIHDLQTTSQLTELWPWLLVLALLLWPLDIALRRVSLGRRELADGRRWIGDRVHGRRVAARTRAGRGAVRGAGAGRGVERPVRDHARGRRAPGAGGHRAVDLACVDRRQALRPRLPAPRPRPPSPAPASSPSAAPTRTRAGPRAGAREDTPPPAGPEDTLARLREAKRRSRG